MGWVTPPTRDNVPVPTAKNPKSAANTTANNAARSATRNAAESAAEGTAKGAAKGAAKSTASAESAKSTQSGRGTRSANDANGTRRAEGVKGAKDARGAKDAKGVRGAGSAGGAKRTGGSAAAPAPAAADRRRELLATAADVFAAQGYNATTVRQIADAAGMLAGSLYYHFDSKESMVDEILAAFLDELWAGYDAVLAAGLGPRETVEALVTESFREIDRHRAAVAIYQKEAQHLATQPRFGYLTASQQKFERAWLGTLERGVAEGVFRSDLDLRLAYRFLRDTVWVAASWYRPQGRHSPEEIARQYLTMVLDGITHPA